MLSLNLAKKVDALALAIMFMQDFERPLEIVIKLSPHGHAICM